MRQLKSTLILCFAFPVCILAVSAGPALAQTTTTPAPVTQARITQAIDEKNLVTLRGNVHPLARPEFDQGPVADAQPLKRMLLLLQRSPEQEAALQQLLEDQQNKSSANYHAWLTPDQFGRQFGPADADIQSITQWLTSHGFTNIKLGVGRTVIEFSGNVASVRNAFHTEMHRYLIKGEEHLANASDPQIPAALAPAVAGLVSLHNFPRKPMHHLSAVLTRPRNAGQISTQPLKPDFTFQCGNDPNTGQPIYCSELGPYDFASIYNVLPLWNAAPAIDGTGQTIAIVGQSNIKVQDVRDFRTAFGLPANDPVVVLNGPDPGLIPGDETEADLDVQLSGSVAKGATINLVVSQSTETTAGVDLSAEYIVDNNLAPVLSESFGNCELFLGAVGNQFYNNLWQQAAAQGISVFVSSGDNGSAGCDFNQGVTPQAANNGLQVNGIASTPYNTAVGGTDFNDFFNFLTYWNTSNDPTTQQSAKGYIPETTWNDSCTNAIFGDPRIGFSTNAETNCNNSRLSGFVFTGGGSGGKSNCTTPSGQTPSACGGGYAKPGWQIGSGVPPDGKRDLPDVSLFASDGFVGNSYAICETDIIGFCNASNLLPLGGTSASAPAFAAIMALVNQKTLSHQGNANVVLYKLATSQTASTCNSSTGPASTCIFNDVTSGTIAMPCAKGGPNCTTSNSNDQYGILSGYNAGTGYDLATGLGSVNVQNLVNNWSSVKFLPSSTTLSATVNGTAVSSISVAHGTPVVVSSNVSAGSGASGTPTGQVALMAAPNPTPGNLSSSLGIEALSLTNGAASGTGIILPGGSYSLTAHYQGDATFSSSDSTPGIPVNITAESSKTLVSIPTFDPTTGLETGNTPSSLVYGSPYLARIDVGNAKAALSFPPKPICTPPSCPNGTITWTDSLNGAAAAPLDGGTLALNSDGYSEDQKIQLSGGSHVLSASYSGDNSYNASSGIYALAITPAPTTFGIQLFTTNSVVQGMPFQIYATGSAQTPSGASPTGTVTFFDGTNQLGNPVVVNGNPGMNGSSPSFSLVTPLTIAAGGAHSLTAQYSGDANYASSSSAPLAITVLYATTATITVSPSTVNYGSTVTVTAIVDTAVPTSNAALKPSGTISLSGSFDGPITSGVTTTATADASGNWEIQATVSITPSNSEFFFLNYGGDNDYAGGSASSNFLTVIIPDFTLGPVPLSVAPVAGQTGSGQITITPASQTPSIVNLSLQFTPTIPGYTLSLSPQQVNLSGSPATATLSLTSTVPVPAAATMMVTRQAGFLGQSRNNWWAFGVASGLAALFLVGFPGRRKRYRAALGFGLTCLVCFAIGCGGGTAGPPPPPPSPTTITLTTSSAKADQNSQFTITAIVTGSNSLTGTVTFYDNGNQIFSPNIPLNNGQVQATNYGYVYGIGVHQFKANYSGSTGSLASTSNVLTQVVTGRTTVTIQGSTGGDVHYLQATIGLQ